MPLYEFKCRSCEHVFEHRISLGDPFPSCEACGGLVKKVFHPAPIIFKGSGWHITDYGRKGAKSQSSSALSDISTSEASKSETKLGSTSTDKVETSATS
jgi:putative FmdB family regulatory protein